METTPATQIVPTSQPGLEINFTDFTDPSVGIPDALRTNPPMSPDDPALKFSFENLSPHLVSHQDSVDLVLARELDLYQDEENSLLTRAFEAHPTDSPTDVLWQASRSLARVGLVLGHDTFIQRNGKLLNDFPRRWSEFTAVLRALNHITGAISHDQTHYSTEVRTLIEAAKRPPPLAPEVLKGFSEIHENVQSVHRTQAVMQQEMLAARSANSAQNTAIRDMIQDVIVRMNGMSLSGGLRAPTPALKKPAPEAKAKGKGSEAPHVSWAAIVAAQEQHEADVEEMYADPPPPSPKVSDRKRPAPVDSRVATPNPGAPKRVREDVRPAAAPVRGRPGRGRGGAVARTRGRTASPSPAPEPACNPLEAQAKRIGGLMATSQAAGLDTETTAMIIRQVMLNDPAPPMEVDNPLRQVEALPTRRDEKLAEAKAISLNARAKPIADAKKAVICRFPTELDGGGACFVQESQVIKDAFPKGFAANGLQSLNRVVDTRLAKDGALTLIFQFPPSEAETRMVPRVLEAWLRSQGAIHPASAVTADPYLDTVFMQVHNVRVRGSDGAELPLADIERAIRRGNKWLTDFKLKDPILRTTAKLGDRLVPFSQQPRAQILSSIKDQAYGVVECSFRDTRSGVVAARIIQKKSLRINSVDCPVHIMSTNPHVPQCQNCFCWGHLAYTCKKVPVCSFCGRCGHKIEDHNVMASCCSATNTKDKALPPAEFCDATTSCGPRCHNCGEPHAATARICDFFKKRTNSGWHGENRSAYDKGFDPKAKKVRGSKPDDPIIIELNEEMSAGEGGMRDTPVPSDREGSSTPVPSIRMHE
ncbi:hypothetical protein EUX98_g8905 [Antrodiella citrinella]|uniref:Gag-like protein n=1 Tax=Antrodiella citrinella TaxID=2447956 RepID=A0A4S4M2Z9_9APHY|nr:hypothetical protein EUX98_g8905 [Antrodiella citrinella]